MFRWGQKVVRSPDAFFQTARRHALCSTMTTQESPALQSRIGGRKRERQGGPAPKRQRMKKEKHVKEGSNQEVLLADVQALFATQTLSETSKTTEFEAADSQHSNDISHEDLPTPFSE